MLPDPAVEIPGLPITLRMFAAGTAVPESVTNDVGTDGGTGPAAKLL